MVRFTRDTSRHKRARGSEVINQELLARNCLALLQQDPAIYRSFGYYWWPIKRLLKRYYNRDNLYLLGDYEDKEAAEKLSTMPEYQVLLAALVTHQDNRLHHMDSPYGHDLYGNPYTVVDQDAGF